MARKNLRTYREILRQLPLDNPSAAQLKKLFPYIPNIDKRVEKQEFLKLAIPPLRVDGCCHYAIISYKVGQTFVTLYDKVIRNVGEVYPDILFQKEALKYAQQHWGKRLVSREGFVDCVELRIAKPYQPDIFIQATLNERFDETLNDDIIIYISDDPIVKEELNQGLECSTLGTYCHCGNPLVNSYCQKCDISYPNKTDSYYSMPLKIRTFLKSKGYPTV